MEPTKTAITLDSPLLTTTDEKVLAVVTVEDFYFWRWCEVEEGANDRTN